VESDEKRERLDELYKDLKFQHISGQHKIFNRMSPTDGENLLTKIGPENLQKEYAFSMCNLNLRQVSINANIVSSEICLTN
jgi:hypothetical protein